MKTRYLNIFSVILMLSITVSSHFSCNKSDGLIVVPTYLEVNLPLLTLNYERYYTLNHHTRSIELVFSHEIIEESVSGNLNLSDKNGSLSPNYSLIVDGKIIFIRFHNNYYLKDGWKYDLSISQGLKSVEGLTVVSDEIVEFRTRASRIPNELPGTSNDTLRTIIAVISDIHCGDQRASDGNYSWFGKNADALVAFLEFIKSNPKVKELVILGDLFDEWMVLYEFPPFDSSVNITNSKEYFYAILNGTFLYGSAIYEYLVGIFALDAPKIVAFEHSHEPEIRVFPLDIAYTGIYANSGSWIDANQSKYDVRTYLMISPGAWTGSELDVVTLYQYNPDGDSSGQGITYKPHFIKEENIKIN